jgi:hypothetical protein
MPFPNDEMGRDFIRQHFRRKHLVWTEEYFIEALKSPKKHDVYWAVIALRDCGTTRCVAALRGLLEHPMDDVKTTSSLTIAHVAGPSETPLYAAALLSPQYKHKGYAMWAILDAADERAVDAVLQYFHKNRAKLRRGKLANGTVVDRAKYLSRFTESRSDTKTFFDDLRAAWPHLAEGERNELRGIPAAVPPGAV